MTNRSPLHRLPQALVRRSRRGDTRPTRRAEMATGLVAILLPLIAGPGAVAGEIDASGARLTKVTVYADRSEAVRSAAVQVPAGGSTVRFRGLPWATEADSLRVEGRGVAAVIGAVELIQEAGEPAESPELLAARAEVERLEAAIAELDAAETTTNELREFIKALKATTAQRESERLGEGGADPASIQAVYDLVRTSLTGLSNETIKRRQQRTELSKQLEVARAKLASARPRGPIRSRTAMVEVDARAAGSLTLDLTYVAPGASWRPAYRAVLDAATGQITLGSEAVVRQATGEDWSGVELSLSTAAPSRGVQPPELPPLFLRPVELMAQGGFVNEMDVITSGPAPMMKSKAAREAGLAMADEAVEVDAVVQEAGIVRSSYNVSFKVAGSSDVPGDGRDHRVSLRQESLDGSVSYRAVPALNEAAFLVSKTKAPADYPLLAGPVRVFAGGAFLGSFALAETGPGSEVTLPFGVDNRVKVQRTLLPQSREERGIIGKDRVIQYAFRTTVANLLDRPIKLTVEDRIPVSEDERITVTLEKETTAGHRELKTRPGILEWDLELKAGESREIMLVYSVRFPQDLVIPGL